MFWLRSIGLMIVEIDRIDVLCVAGSHWRMRMEGNPGGACSQCFFSTVALPLEVVKLIACAVLYTFSCFGVQLDGSSRFGRWRCRCALGWCQGWGCEGRHGLCSSYVAEPRTVLHGVDARIKEGWVITLLLLAARASSVATLAIAGGAGPPPPPPPPTHTHNGRARNQALHR